MSVHRASIKVDVRPVAEEEIQTLERHLDSGPPERHRQRFYMQQTGAGVYLVAWYRGLPVGHGLINWSGAPDEPMASRLKDCPDIEDLFVLPAYRSRGIGSQVMAALEELARQRGYSRVGLGVAIDNKRARSLYERRGYVDSGFGKYQHYAYFIDDRGRLRYRSETCAYLIKELT